MPRSQPDSRFARLLVITISVALLAPASVRGQIRADPSALEAAPPELLDRLSASAFAYFRFVNRAWAERVCERFADVTNPAIVRLHGDAHVEQYAVTKDAWGLDDFDDSARGPAYIDIVRFLGSLDLAARQRGWTHERDALWNRFFQGYRKGLTNPKYSPPEPDIVHEMRRKAPVTRAAYLAWGEHLMLPMDEERRKDVVTAMAALEGRVRGERPDVPPGYFTVRRAGWLRIGVGSSGLRKVLIRVQGPTSDPDDDVLLEAKEVANLTGVTCLEPPTTDPAVRIVRGVLQLGRLKHDILAVGPTMLIAAAADRAEHYLDWWVSSWEPSYQEIHLTDLRSVTDLAAIAFDAGVQLGAGKLESIRPQALSSLEKSEARLRKETSAIVEELLAGWREFGAQRSTRDRLPRLVN